MFFYTVDHLQEGQDSLNILVMREQKHLAVLEKEKKKQNEKVLQSDTLAILPDPPCVRLLSFRDRLAWVLTVSLVDFSHIIPF